MAGALAERPHLETAREHLGPQRQLLEFASARMHVLYHYNYHYHYHDQHHYHNDDGYY